MLPSRTLSRGLSRFEREVGAGVFYLHPWELDPQSPVRPGFGGKFLQIGRASLSQRLRSLCRRVHFRPLVDVYLD